MNALKLKLNRLEMLVNELEIEIQNDPKEFAKILSGSSPHKSGIHKIFDFLEWIDADAEQNKKKLVKSRLIQKLGSVMGALSDIKQECKSLGVEFTSETIVKYFNRIENSLNAEEMLLLIRMIISDLRSRIIGYS